MKKTLSLLCGIILSGGALVAQDYTLKENWQNGSFEEEGVYGAEVDRALEFLGGKKAKHRSIVAIIGEGIDTEHKAFKNYLWKNPKEKPDGKDNDGNGLVDDIHGWNFIGSKDGSVMENLMKEGDREWLRMKDKYGDLIFDGKNYYKYENGQRVQVAAPEDMEEYAYYRNLIINYETSLGSAYAGLIFSYEIQRYAKIFFDRMREKFPDQEKYSLNDFKEVNPVESFSNEKDSLEMLVYSVMMMGMNFNESKYKQSGKELEDLSSLIEYYEGDGIVKAAEESWNGYLKSNGNDERATYIGDDPYDINDRGYGNNVHLLSNSAGGTVAAGIIAGKRDRKGRNNPICENAEIMTLNVLNNGGEPYMKDMALAIRYAVEHGADIILCGLQQTVYPPKQRIWVEEALKLAEEKGVLVIFTVGEYAADLGDFTFYPNRFLTTPELTNFMVVAPSNEQGNPFIKSNFGDKEVDLFAPAKNIYSTYMGDSYRFNDGAFLSGAVVAGVAALIKAYYPELTGTQIRNLLNENVTSRAGVEVEKMFMSEDGKQKQDVYLFDELCLSKGIVNAYKAIQAADAWVCDK